MRLGITTDWHLGIPSRYETHHDDIYRSIVEAIDICIKNKVDAIVNLGDVFHHPSGSKNADLRFFRDIADRIIDNNILFYCLVGNHDYSYSTDTLSLFSNVGYGDNFITVNTSNYPIYIGEEVSLIPFLMRKHELEVSHTKFAMIHQEAMDLNEVRTFNKYERIFVREDIDKIHSDKIFGGHIHIPLTVYVHDIPVQYLGSTISTSFAEENVAERFVHILDTEADILSKHKIFSRLWKTITDPSSLRVEEGVIYRAKLSYQYFNDVVDIRNQILQQGGILVDISVELPEKNRNLRSEISREDSTEKLLESWLLYNNIEDREKFIEKHKEIESKLE